MGGTQRQKEAPVKKHLALASAIPALVVLSATAGAPSAATQAAPLSVHQEPEVVRLIVPGDRIVLDYKLESRVKSPAGSLYVRNDLQRRFRRVALRLKGNPMKGGARLSAIVPASALRGHRLLYYAVVRDPKSGRSVTLPARGARGPRSTRILQRPIVVRLGTHRFGQTRAPDAVVARARADEVGWDIGEDHPPVGPQTFQIAADGSVWLQDSINNRLLVWNPGQPDAFARSVPLHGYGGSGDFTFGPAGTIYSSAPGDGHYASAIFRLGAAGEVLSKIVLPKELSFPIPTAQLALRVGPGGTLYCFVPAFVGGLARFSVGEGWMPVATPAGKALSVSQQRRGTLWGYQPLAGGLRLVSGLYVPPHSEKGALDVRYALIDRRGRVVRAWRILSRTEIFPGGPPFFTPELVGGDPVVRFDVVAGASVERIVLRLGPHGARTRFSVPRAVWGDELYADLRIGSGGKLYQLATSPTTGVTISRYALR
jgi:hypothetical protein